MAFQIGDTVRLKSGGAVMTVEKILPKSTMRGGEEGDRLRCPWFNDKNMPQGGYFSPEMLEPVRLPQQ
jgi:uncharacterized protein YodC (DUF2158 family)